MLIGTQNRIVAIACALAILISNLALAGDEQRWKNLEQPVFTSPLSDSTQIEGAIVSVAEDAQGFMWFVARNGLWRWDSQSLTPALFLNSGTDTPTPEAQVIYSDHYGNLWLGTKSGLYQFDRDSHRFVAVAFEQLSFLSIENIIVTEENGQQQIFLAGDRSLHYFNPTDKTLNEIVLPEQTRIHALHADKDKRLWVGTGNGLYFTSSIGAESKTLRPEPTLLNIRISALHTTLANELWIGTATEGYFTRDRQGNVQRKTVGSSSKQPWIYSMAEVAPNILWLGTFGEGLIELDINTGLQRRFNNNRLQPASLADDNVWAVFLDSRGLVWIATANGINVFDSTVTAVKQIYGGLNTGQGLKHRNVHTVNAFDQQLLVGTGPGGIEVLDPVAGSQDALWDASTSAVETLYTAPDGSVYGSGNFTSVNVHTKDSGVTKLNVIGRSETAFTTAFAKTQHSLWLGGTDGLWRQDLEFNAPATQVFSTSAEERRVASLLVNDQMLWVGLWRGLGSVDISTSADTPSLKLIDHPVLRDQFIASMHLDDSGQLWAGTSGVGLFVMVNSAGWQHITVDHGLPGNVVSAISSDDDGRVWVSTTRGIATIDTTTLQISTVVRGAMSVNSPYIRGAVTHTRFNEMVFGGTNGLTVIDANQVNTAFNDLSLVLTKEEVISNSGDLQPSSIANQRLVIAPLFKRVSFEFVAFDFINPKNVVYRYRLRELEDKWTVLDADHRNVSYTSLPPGDYVLEVAYSHDGVHFPKQHLSRYITVMPAWYQVQWVQLVGLLLLCLLILLGHCLGLRQYRKQKLVLEHKVAERTADLIAANQQLSAQAQALEDASLTDALTGLRNRRFLSQNIEDDMAMLHRHYVDCKQQEVTPDTDSDILFFLVDLDHFKRINDQWGHQSGDAVLIEMRNRLEKVFRVVDYLIRWGGEEFLIVARHSCREEANLLAERIVKAVGDMPFEIQKDELKKVTCSIGFAAYPLSPRYFESLTWHETIAIADAALYQAKNNSRDTWMGFTHINPDVDLDTIEQLKTKPQLVFDSAKLKKRS